MNLNLYQPSFRRLLGPHPSASFFTAWRLGTANQLIPFQRKEDA